MYLLDTCAFIWFVESGYKHELSARALDILEDGANRMFISVATGMELSYLVHKKRLTINMSLDDLIHHAMSKNGFQFLAFGPPHLRQFLRMSFHHKDPFDRMLIAQAKSENLTILTNDKAFGKYDVKVAW